MSAMDRGWKRGVYVDYSKTDNEEVDMSHIMRHEQILMRGTKKEDRFIAKTPRGKKIKEVVDGARDQWVEVGG